MRSQFWLSSVTFSLIGLVILSLLLCALLYQRPLLAHYQQNYFYYLLGLLFCLTLVWGVLRTDWALSDYAIKLDKYQPGVVTVFGSVIGDPVKKESHTEIVVQTGEARLLVKTDRNIDVGYGDMVRVQGDLIYPKDFVTDTGRLFPYQMYLAARGLHHIVSFAKVDLVEEAGPSLMVSLYNFKQRFKTAIEASLPEPESGLGLGLLLGISTALGAQLEADFRTAGLSHIVVLSGYNIMIVVTFIMLVLGFILPYKMRLIGGILGVVLFALLVGYAPSVWRASVMAIVMLLAFLLARPHAVLRAFVLTVGILVAHNPLVLVFDIGFQLSCLATLGLVVVSKMVERTLQNPSFIAGLKSFFVTTVATQVAVMPLILYSLGTWSLVAVPVNMLVLPFVSVAMLTTFVTGVGALISPMLGNLLAPLSYIVLHYIIGVAVLVGQWSFATMTLLPFGSFWLWFMYGVMGGVYFLYQGGWSKLQTFINERMTNHPTHLPVGPSVDVSHWIIESEANIRPTQTSKPRASETSGTGGESSVPPFFR